MNSLLLASALNLSINCEQLSSQVEIWQQQICAQLTNQYKDVQLVSVKITDKVITPPKKESFVEVGELMAGRLTVNLIAEIDKQYIQRRYLFSVKAHQFLWVTKRKMYKGDTIKESDLIQKWINVAPFVGLKTVSNEKPISRRLNRSINTNGIIFSDYIEVDSLVNERQILDLTMMSKGLQIKTKAIALERAIKVGDKIKIRVVETGAIIEAEVRGKKDVYVEI